MESSADAGALAYSLGAAGPAPAVRPAAIAPPAATGGRAGTRYVLVPVTDPRASGYY